MPAVPTQQQLEWQRGEMYLFIHYGINTFTGREWGEGDEDPRQFNPQRIDVEQWVDTAKKAGFLGIVFTAKHHEGFALWPSAYSDFTVARSPWMNGAGDVVRMVADACREAGLKFGIYLSPWDRHEPSYGTPAYDDFYVSQLTELLTGYGPIFEVWLDNARLPGISFQYDFDRYFEVIRELQPDALIAISGPDIRWAGNERGEAPLTLWSNVSETRWYPMECDVPNRPHWFWRRHEDKRVKTLLQHLDLYYNCVGRNGVLLYNIPPNRDGVFPQLDVQRVLEFRSALDDIFGRPLMRDARVTASTARGRDWGARHALDGDDQTFWATGDGVTSATLDVDIGACVTFNTIELEEPVQLGQRIRSYRIEGWHDEGWVSLSVGTTVGHKKLDRIQAFATSRLRLIVEDAKRSIALQSFELYWDDFRHPSQAMHF